MKYVTANGTTPWSKTITVPQGCVAVAAFISAGAYIDNATADEPIRAYLSADSSDTASVIESGSLAPSKNWWIQANQNFPKIPVQEGETLLVSSKVSGSAIVYFDEAT